MRLNYIRITKTLVDLENQIRDAFNRGEIPQYNDSVEMLKKQIRSFKRHYGATRNYVENNVDGKGSNSPMPKRRLIFKITNTVTTIIQVIEDELKKEQNEYTENDENLLKNYSKNLSEINESTSTEDNSSFYNSSFDMEKDDLFEQSTSEANLYSNKINKVINNGEVLLKNPNATLDELRWFINTSQEVLNDAKQPENKEIKELKLITSKITKEYELSEKISILIFDMCKQLNQLEEIYLELENNVLEKIEVYF